MFEYHILELQDCAKTSRMQYRQKNHLFTGALVCCAKISRNGGLQWLMMDGVRYAPYKANTAAM